MNAMQPEQIYLLHLLSSTLHGAKPENPPENIDWRALYSLAFRHGLSNMACYGLNNISHDSRPPMEVTQRFQEDCKKAIAKEATQHIAVEQMLKNFEENHILCMPLKGYLIKYLYPRPDMRLMADVDILIKDEQSKKIKELMVAMGFTLERFGGNHDIYHRKPFLNVEIHRRIIAEDSPCFSYLGKTWDRVKLKAGCRYIYRLSHEDFYIYMMIHLTKHYICGGTGIRSFLDIWVYSNHYKDEMDWEYIWAELEKVKLREFAENAVRLCGVWFGNEQSNELYNEMSQYIFKSGAYGTVENSMASAISLGADCPNSFRAAKQMYRLRLCFPPIATMKILYPSLRAFPFFLPLCWGLRGIRCLVFKSRHTFRMLHDVDSFSEEGLIKALNLHKKAGLWK